MQNCKKFSIFFFKKKNKFFGKLKKKCKNEKMQNCKNFSIFFSKKKINFSGKLKKNVKM